MSFSMGQRVADYEIEGILGTGGMGRVYRVRNVISQRTEAMKVLLADLQAEPELAARFLSEIRTLAALDHPNIAQLHTAQQVGNEFLMIIEFVDGLTLQQMAQKIPLPPEKVFNYIQQVLAALSFAHQRGVIHRDVKPANIMVTPQGVVKLTDFGIAKSKVRSQHTLPGTTMGSLHYMSPEQAQGSPDVDARSDLYSVGITLYELLAGCLPFTDESAYVLLQSQLHDAPRPPVEVNPALSPAVNDLILRALEKNPALRFQSASSFSEALERATGIAAWPPIERGVLPVEAASSAITTPVPIIEVPAAPISIPMLKTRSGFGKATAAAAVIGLAAAVGTGLSHVWTTSAAASDAVLTAAVLSAPAAAPVESQSNTVSLPMESRPLEVPAPSIPEEPQRVAPATHATKHERTVAAKVVKANAEQGRNEPEQIEGDGSKAAESRAIVRPAGSAELQSIREEKAKLDLRAAALRASVLRLKSQREADGDSLDQDLAGAYVRMNAYLNAETSDLEDGDAAAARDHMQKAAQEVNLLEGMFKSPQNQVAAKR